MVLHPLVATRHCPGLQFDKVVLGLCLPVLLGRLVVAAGLVPRCERQAGSGRRLSAIEPWMLDVADAWHRMTDLYPI